MIASSILLILAVLNLGIALAKHGQVEVKKNNFWSTFFSIIILLTLYYYAGLFDCFKE